jgi:predicted tellurium resistance membrane protein TerC
MCLCVCVGGVLSLFLGCESVVIALLVELWVRVFVGGGVIIVRSSWRLLHTHTHTHIHTHIDLGGAEYERQRQEQRDIQHAGQFASILFCISLRTAIKIVRPPGTVPLPV